MKKILLCSVILVVCVTSCRKEYVCVCTQKSTGDKSYGDRMKSGPAAKKAFEENCEANNKVFGSDLENCHLE